ncbi:MAG: ABC transporter permease [Chloroflexota bacterium]|nr:ABC transporter permease [Chloroflexota bacterium]
MTTYPTSTLELNAARVLTATGNEIHKGLRQAWAERVQIIIELPLFVSFALLFSIILGRGQQVAATGTLSWRFDPYQTSWFFLGFMVFTFAYLQSVKMFWRLLGEIQTGTLEQVYLSPLPAWLNVAVGRLAATLVETVFVVGVAAVVVALAAGLRLTWRPEALIPLALAAAGGAGYSLVIAGLTLAWKRVELLQEFITTLIMFISGALLPLDAFPSWVQDVSAFTFITHPIAALRTTLLDGKSIGLWGTGGWVWMAAMTGAWLLIGVLVFSIGNASARRRGSLSRY